MEHVYGPKHVKCVNCGKEFDISYSGYNTIVRKAPENNGIPKFQCKECRSKARSERNRVMNAKRWSDPEEHAKMSAKKKSFWDNIGEDKRSEILGKINAGKKAWEENLTDEQRAVYSKNRSEGQYRRYKNPNERARSTEYWESLTEDQKNEIRNRLTNESNSFWSDIINRQKQADRLSSMMLEYWQTRTPEQMIDINKKKSVDTKEWWDSLTAEEKAIFTRNKMIRSPNGNSLSNKFMQAFNESILSNEFYIIQEYPAHNNNVSHCWDYAIFNKLDGKLVMLVDLDGAFYHADQCDYDGLHSKEEYDEKRSLSVPDGVIPFIIQELNFAKCFDEMVKYLFLNYDEYVLKLFNDCRIGGFPFPHYTDIELARSWQSLMNLDCNDKYHDNMSLNTRVGDRIIQHFHHSIYYAHRDGELSPYEAWNNDDLLMQVIHNRTIYQTYLNPNKILQGFNVSKIAPKVSVFSAGRAKMIISKYLSEYDTIFDPFSGFSGRMLGTLSLGKRYIGHDISDIHIGESRAIIRFLNRIGISTNIELQQADASISTGTYPCLFTCSPYSDKEQWLEVPRDTRTCDDWVDICLHNYNCKRYVFVVDGTTRYKDYITDIISSRSHFNLNNEYILVIDK